MARGSVTICFERCKGCELCIHACPQKVLRLSDDYNSRGYRSVMVDETLNLCTGCAICAVVCPDAVFTVWREAPTTQLPQAG